MKLQKMTVSDIELKFGPNAPIIGLFGTWYDVSLFIDHHPGGDVIVDYFGLDATAVFKVWHNNNQTGRPPLVEYGSMLKAVGRYKLELHPLDRELLKVHQQILNSNDYEPGYLWLLSKILFTISMFAISAFGAKICTENGWTTLRYFFAMPWALGWQQSGFMMHDAMHSILVRDYKSWTMWKWLKINVNHFLGWIFGSILFGVNSNHWHHTHVVHHVFTATIDNEMSELTDPQFSEAVFMLSEKAMNLTGDLYRIGKMQPIQDIFLLYQQYFWLPLCILIGRFSVMIDSWSRERSLVWLSALILHHLKMVAFYRFVGFESFVDFALFWYAAAIFQGLLTIQLLVSHYDKPFEKKEDHIAMGWFYRQATVVKDIQVGPSMDWFFGGLQFHLAHHVLPKLPRKHYRKYTPILKRILKEHANVEVDTVSFLQSIKDTLKHLGDVAEKYGIWKTLQEFQFE